jgi:GTP pyrophosphokinase
MVTNEEKLIIIDNYKRLLRLAKTGMRKGDTILFRKALKISYNYFNDKRTRWGEPLMLRQLELAEILAIEMGLNANSIVPLFIYEACRDGEISRQEIETSYGTEVLGIVDSLLTIETLNFSKISIESENFRKMLLSMVHDIRAILIRLVMTLYELRHFQKYDAEYQNFILRKSEHIYIPFSHRLGLYRIKTEMEELTMKYALPEVYHAIEQGIIDSKPKQTAFIEDFIAPIRHELGMAGFDCDIKWRYKSIPSIYSKMKKQQVSIDGIYDLFAIRIISNSVFESEKADCWKIYSIVSNIYPPNPSRLRDWISAPKASGYESLHTTVNTEGNRIVEVQIRTKRMDDVAEKGTAAHWRYKESKEAGNVDNWLQGIRGILEKQSVESDHEFDAISGFKSDHIYVLTPAGDVKQLKTGATLLDFAFEVHTKLGSTCVGGKVNNKIATIKQVLKNGDVVDILTSKNQTPKPDWLSFVITTKARARIKRAMNEGKINEAEQGKAALARRCRNWKVNLNDENIEKLLKYFKFKTALDLYSSLALEKTDWLDVKKVLVPLPAEDKGSDQPKTLRISGTGRKNYKKPEDNIVIEGTEGHLSYTLAKCCSPIFGDDVYGFITIGKGVSVHRKNCTNAAALVQKHTYRQVGVKWRDTGENQSYQTLIRITGDDRLGILNDITKIISGELNINVLSINIESRDGLFDGKIKVHVNDTRHLDELLHKLAKIKGVAKARRYYD